MRVNALPMGADPADMCVQRAIGRHGPCGVGLGDWQWIDILVEDWYWIGRLAWDWQIGDGFADLFRIGIRFLDWQWIDRLVIHWQIGPKLALHCWIGDGLAD